MSEFNKNEISNKKTSIRFIDDIRQLIEDTKLKVATSINTCITLLYWQIGKRINDEILNGKRAEYGKEIVATLSQELVTEYGKGFSYSALTRMISFSEAFPDKTIVATLSQQLSWSHFKEILPCEDQLQHEFYAEMCRIEGWSVRVLRKKIDSMLYKRTALSKKPDELIKKELVDLREKNKLSPDLIFRDPYVLDFLNLKDTFSEKDLERAILREIESFILELGFGFTFITRQKRMIIDIEDHYLDLLFYHRKLKRLIAIELKIGKFKAAYKGQMELYLRWLEKNEMEPNENLPLGLILCAEGSHETIKFLQLDNSGIHVAEYLTELPPRELLMKKLHSAVELAKARLEVSERVNGMVDNE